MVNQKYNPKDVLEYLKNHTYKQTMEDLGISEMQISRIKKKSLESPKDDSNVSDVSGKTGINEPLKKAIKTVFDEMWDSLPTKSQKSIIDQYAEEINQIMGVIV
jgi:hypothetical protein